MILKTHEEHVDVTSGAKQVELTLTIAGLGYSRTLVFSPEKAAELGLQLLAHARKQGWVPLSPAALFIPEYGLETPDTIDDADGCHAPVSRAWLRALQGDWENLTIRGRRYDRDLKRHETHAEFLDRVKSSEFALLDRIPTEAELAE